MAVLYENKRENFLCKHCNIMYKGLGVEGYIDTQKVMQCRRREDLASGAVGGMGGPGSGAV